MSKTLRLTAVLALAAATLAVPTAASAAGYPPCVVPQDKADEVACIKYIVETSEPGANRGQTISDFISPR